MRAEVMDYREVKQTIRKQSNSGAWGQNLLGIAPSAAQGIRSVGTVAQYRHLLELGVPPTERPFAMADRLFFRVLSKDEDPALLFEHKKGAKTNPELGAWARGMMRQGAAAALAHAGRHEDPRVRGAAHRMMTDVSQFLRSELASDPITRAGSRNILHPEASPPTYFTVAVVAFMPRIQRERAGFVERLAAYLGKPPPKRTYTILLGKKVVKPLWTLLGNPLQADSSGRPKDLALALHWLELLARIGGLDASPSAQRVLARLLRDCNDEGVWSPKNLRAIPKSASKLADFAFPLELDGRVIDRRRTDVTFRLALITRLLGWEQEIH